MASRTTEIASRRSTHVALIVVGALFLLTGAFHGNIWFDESYSVAIASKSFADICSIGSGDVHPVLYYFALHVIYLLSGSVTHVTAYRVFTVCGAVAMALVGYTHVRRDMGWKVGLLFTFFALFTPYVSFLSIEVRMYSWASCMAMLTFVYGYRIIGAQKRADERTGADANAPLSTWVKFALCSLSAAYLHYFALLSAFVINLGVLVFLVAHRKGRKRDLAAFVVQAVCQVAAYAPWLVVLASQMGVVSNTYWVNFKFPDTLISLLRYPLYTMQATFATGGVYGVVPMVISYALVVAGLALLVVVLVRAFLRVRRHAKERGGLRASWAPARAYMASPEALPGLLGLGVYVGLFLVAGVASVLMHSLMLYFRYLFCAIGPLLFALAFFLARFDERRTTAAVCTLFLAFSLFNQALMIHDDYSPDNQAPIEYLRHNATADQLVLSSDIGIEGVTAVEIPDLPQYYLDWQPGNWGRAYECYSPTLTSIPNNWDAKLGDYHGLFWVLGESSDGSRPNDVDDLATRDGVHVVESERFFRPYTRGYFTITLMVKD